MVFVPVMIAALAVGAVNANSASQSLPSFHIPAFDYTTIVSGNTPSRVLEALQSDGIIALQNIPNYANLRTRYLRKAAECAALTGSDSFISRKLFDDGTLRRTISTNAGRELKGSAIATDAACPGYRMLYEEFSQILEHAVNTFGSALDKSSFVASDGERTTSSRRLVSDSVRLDHFHLYEADPLASTRTNEQHRKLELSLPLHEDHGLFIAMSAPKLFDLTVNSPQLVERHLAEEMSGLVIQTSSGNRVRPVLKEDELVIMMGTGASRWLQTSHYLPAVMHGMKMPEGLEAVEAGTRRLRAWFGKMTLLPAYQRILSTQGGVFEEHVNATRRYLLENDQSAFQTVGCATGRHLQVSDKCTFRSCTPKEGASTTEPCSTICNREGHGPEDVENCAKNCKCRSESGPGIVCWMLCVANLPTSVCPMEQQKCSDDQKMLCVGSTVSPSSPLTDSPTTAPTDSVTTAPTNEEATSEPGMNNDNAMETMSSTTGSASQSGNGSGSSSTGSSSDASQNEIKVPTPSSTPSSDSPVTTISATLLIVTLVNWTL